MKFPPCSSRSKATDILYFFHRHYVVNHHVREIFSIVIKTTVAKLSLKVDYKNIHKLALMNQLNKWLSWIIYIFSVHCFIYSKLKVSLTFRQSVLWFNTIVLSFFQLSKNSQMFFSSNSWLIRIRNLNLSVALAFSHARPQIFSLYSPGFVYKHKSLPDWRYISQNIYCIDSISLYSQICT